MDTNRKSPVNVYMHIAIEMLDVNPMSKRATDFVYI